MTKLVIDSNNFNKIDNNNLWNKDIKINKINNINKHNKNIERKLTLSCLKELYLNEVIKKLTYIKLKGIFFPNQSKEIEQGNREYKLNLDYSLFKYNSNQLKNIFNKKATQMNYRLNEGSGKAIYFIGIEDNGIVNGIKYDVLINSLIAFCHITKITKCKFNKIRIYQTKDGYCATIRIFKSFKPKHLLLELD